jgi:hypothetical protein
MKDVLGEDLVVGDVVVTTRQGYSNLKIVQIVGFTPKKIRVTGIHGYSELKDTNQVVKVDPKLYFHMLLTKKAK